MRLFWKIFLMVLICFFLVFSSFSYISITRQISEAENNLIEQNKALGSFIAKEAEVGYLESRWPFENLRILTERKDFLFWWILKEDETIYLADKASFMETSATAYFPQMKNLKGDGQITLNREKNYGIYTTTFETGKLKWSFWLGFSLKEVAKMKRDTLMANLASFVIITSIMAALLFWIVNHLTRPIKDLVNGTQLVARGNLNHQLAITTNDELGDLARAFNQMTVKLKQSYTILEEKVAQRTKDLEEAKKQLENVNLALEGKVKERTSELENLKEGLEKTVAQRTIELNQSIAELKQHTEKLEKMNQLMVGRELKMIELKKEIENLKSQLSA